MVTTSMDPFIASQMKILERFKMLERISQNPVACARSNSMILLQLKQLDACNTII